jgi:hypothetical protein
VRVRTEPALREVIAAFAFIMLVLEVRKLPVRGSGGRGDEPIMAWMYEYPTIMILSVYFTQGFAVSGGSSSATRSGNI